MSAEAPSLIPKPRPAADFARRLAEAAKARIAAESAAKYALPSGSCWALTCQPGRDPHIGILFAEGVDPLRAGAIHGGMWFSSTHELGDPARGREDVICSQCLAETGEERPLRVLPVAAGRDLGFCFTVPSYWERFLFKVDGAKIKALLGTPELEPKPAPAPEPKPAAKPEVKS